MQKVIAQNTKYYYNTNIHTVYYESQTNMTESPLKNQPYPESLEGPTHITRARPTGKNSHQADLGAALRVETVRLKPNSQKTSQGEPLYKYPYQYLLKLCSSDRQSQWQDQGSAKNISKNYSKLSMMIMSSMKQV